MNRVILMGRLVRDPEVRYTNNEKVLCNFTVAVDRPYQKDAEVTVDFFGCVAWNKQAETIGNYFHKGNKILLEGRMQNRKYTNKEGVEKFVTECWVDRFEFVETKAAAAAKPAPGSAVSAMDAFGPSEDIPF